jgi:hypothetical protein
MPSKGKRCAPWARAACVPYQVRFARRAWIARQLVRVCRCAARWAGRQHQGFIPCIPCGAHHAADSPSLPVTGTAGTARRCRRPTTTSAAGRPACARRRPTRRAAPTSCARARPRASRRAPASASARASRVLAAWSLTTGRRATPCRPCRGASTRAAMQVPLHGSRACHNMVSWGFNLACRSRCAGLTATATSHAQDTQRRMQGTLSPGAGDERGALSPSGGSREAVEAAAEGDASGRSPLSGRCGPTGRYG